jgi:hypothetical protein
MIAFPSMDTRSVARVRVFTHLWEHWSRSGPGFSGNWGTVRQDLRAVSPYLTIGTALDASKKPQPGCHAADCARTP